LGFLIVNLKSFYTELHRVTQSCTENLMNHRLNFPILNLHKLWIGKYRWFVINAGWTFFGGAQVAGIMLRHSHQAIHCIFVRMHDWRPGRFLLSLQKNDYDSNSIIYKD
jgi:hypothetical protein